MTARERVAGLVKALPKVYPDAHCELDFRNPLELLVATILSAQCTDKRVNAVTPALFAKYRSAADYAKAPPATMEKMIRSTGFFRSKTKSVRGAAAAIVAEHGGRVPDTMEKLHGLPGVGRKTANVVLGNAFGEPAIAVDTHVFRVSQRLGLARSDDPVDIHDQLVQVLPRKTWTRVSHLIQAHGRRTCTARKPVCPVCPVRTLCPWPDKTRP
jgi:endonuclease-3